MITIDKFNELTTELIGQPLTQVSDSYGDVFVLHFGNLNNYTHPKLSHLKQGDYELVIKMSKCGLICVRNYSELKQVKIDCLLNQTLQHIGLEEDLQLTLAFKNDVDNFTDLDIIPDDNETELPYWELWIPGDNYIVADSTGLQLLSKYE